MELHPFQLFLLLCTKTGRLKGRFMVFVVDFLLNINLIFEIETCLFPEILAKLQGIWKQKKTNQRLILTITPYWNTFHRYTYNVSVSYVCVHVCVCMCVFVSRCHTQRWKNFLQAPQM